MQLAAYGFVVFLALASRAEAQAVDLELVLAVDVSGSIDFEEARLQRQGYMAAFLDPIVLSAIMSGPLGRIAVTYVEWSGAFSRATTIDWMIIDGPAAAEIFVAALESAPLHRGRFTSISGAIEFALPMFDQNTFEGNRRVIDISGDGPNNNGTLVNEARDVAAMAGVTVNGLPIINDRLNPFGLPQLEDLDIYFEHCVIAGPGAFVVVAEGFDDFGSAIRRKLILEIAGRLPDNIHRAQGYAPPPCDIGEQIMRQFCGNRFNFDTF
ncbi:MAG: DUF1194 domain-containing protein [Alphaproteobacteria bacterium]|nr:DUF1194 domain-containing protein [Alphaproteobacteria bacterium]